jgi:hypothetical protein
LYRDIEDDLTLLKFRTVLMLPPWNPLQERSEKAERQDVRIPLVILKRHLELYRRARRHTRLPTFVLRQEHIDLKKILEWARSR